MKRFFLCSALLALFAGCASAPAPSASPASAPAPAVERTVELAVGETRRIADHRAGACGAEAPSFAAISASLPASPLVAYSDGGLGQRESRSCGGPVSVRVINGTGLQAGEAALKYDAGLTRLVVR